MPPSTPCKICHQPVCKTRYIGLQYNFTHTREPATGYRRWFADEFYRLATRSDLEIRQYVITSPASSPNSFYVFIDADSVPGRGDDIARFVMLTQADERGVHYVRAVCFYQTCQGALDHILWYKRRLRDGKLFALSKAIGWGRPGSFLRQLWGVTGTGTVKQVAATGREVSRYGYRSLAHKDGGYGE
jgi:hypothetical protein